MSINNGNLERFPAPLQEWLQTYIASTILTFGTRVAFIGLQGSQARGEARPESDLDIVLILDKLNFEDLKTYQEMLQTLPESAKICGFISGKAEIAAWDAGELFQFVNDTVALAGDLKELVPPLKREASRKAVHSGACMLYHAVCHNFLYEQSWELAASLYKNALFVLQAKYYYNEGDYLRTHKGMGKELKGQDAEIWQRAIKLKRGDSDTKSLSLEELSQPLQRWSARLVREFAPKR